MHSSFPRQAEADSARYGVDVRTPLTEAGLRRRVGAMKDPLTDIALALTGGAA